MGLLGSSGLRTGAVISSSYRESLPWQLATLRMFLPHSGPCGKADAGKVLRNGQLSERGSYLSEGCAASREGPGSLQRETACEGD